MLLGRGGATYAGFVNGILQSVVKVPFFPLDLVFGVLYGALVDIFATLLLVRKSEKTGVKRMTATLGLASTITRISVANAVIALNINLGAATSSLTTMQLIDYVYVPIIVWGILSGALGGFISARIWERNLKARFKSVQPPVG